MVVSKTVCLAVYVIVCTLQISGEISRMNVVYNRFYTKRVCQILKFPTSKYARLEFLGDVTIGLFLENKFGGFLSLLHASTMNNVMKWTGHGHFASNIVSHTFSKPCKTKIMAAALVLKVSNCSFVHGDFIGITDELWPCRPCPARP